jgi:Secretion system C-terminal sorting domain
MKKILLATIISGSSFCAFAQPTMDFESWSGTGANIAPLGWVSENAAIYPPLLNNPQSVYQATAADAHGGTYALEIRSVKMQTNPATTMLPDPIGIAATGTVSIVPTASLKFGFPNSSRPGTIDFWYKYSPAGGDMGGCFIVLTAWNTGSGKRDTIANGLWTTTAAAAAYVNQSVPLTYYSNTTPDSMAIIFSSTNLFNPNYTLCLKCGKAGSILWVDDIKFTASNGIAEHLSSQGVSVYPNPASDHITIAVEALGEAFSVSTFDATGRLVGTVPLALSGNAMNRRTAMINTADLSSGLYSYSVLDKNGVALRAGKFSVAR